MRAAQASASLRICADSPESSLLENALCINLIMISLKVDSILERIVLNQPGGIFRYIIYKCLLHFVNSPDTYCICVNHPLNMCAQLSSGT